MATFFKLPQGMILTATFLSWLVVSPPADADAFSSIGCFGSPQHMKRQSRRQGSTVALGKRSVQRNGWKRDPQLVAKLTSVSERAEFPGIISDGASHGLKTGKEALQVAAQRLVPLFSDVDAHTQR